MWDLEPFDEIRRMQRQLDGMFREIKPPTFAPTFGDKMSPFVDIVDADKEIVVTADIPGAQKEDISINVRGDIMEIVASRREEKEEKKKDYWRRERSYNQFYRSIQLPVSVDDKRAKASFKNGVLEVRLPKLEIEKKRGIPIE
ncbi:MAG: Hsp20/alpha crystallin family protein [Methanosarcinales archaeon Met12]|nr:MAG: Hsp20/alpha crystallin family protein [Methanosarcinales archaeon Met12]